MCDFDSYELLVGTVCDCTDISVINQHIPFVEDILRSEVIDKQGLAVDQFVEELEALECV